MYCFLLLSNQWYQCTHIWIFLTVWTSSLRIVMILPLNDRLFKSGGGNLYFLLCFCRKQWLRTLWQRSCLSLAVLLQHQKWKQWCKINLCASDKGVKVSLFKSPLPAAVVPDLFTGELMSTKRTRTETWTSFMWWCGEKIDPSGDLDLNCHPKVRGALLCCCLHQPVGRQPL